MKLARFSGLEDIVGIGVGTTCAILCTLLLVAGSQLFDMGGSIPPIDGAHAPMTSDLYDREPIVMAAARPDTDDASQTEVRTVTETGLKPPVGFVAGPGDIPAVSAAEPHLPAENESRGASVEPDGTAADKTLSPGASMASRLMLPREKPTMAVFRAVDQQPVADASFAGAEMSVPLPDAKPSDEPADRPADTVSLAHPESQSLGGPPAPWAVVHYAEDGLAATAKSFAENIQANGIPDTVVRQVRADVDFNQIRYYHETDADLAEQVRAALSGPGRPYFEVADFTGFRPQPKDGLIEVWFGSEPDGEGQATLADDPISN